MAMESSKGPSNFRNLNYAGKHSLLPPKSPFPCISPAYADYGLIPAIAPRAVQKAKEGNFYHQRTSSESLLVDEQPSWLEDLLSEPETPVKRVGHRRSSSDSSFAYLDIANSSNMDNVAQDEYKFKNLVPVPSWAAQESENYKDIRHVSSLAELNSIRRQKNRPWGPSPNFVAYPSSIPSAKDNIVLQNLGKPTPQDAAAAASTMDEKQEAGESGLNDMAASEKGDGSSAKTSATDTDTKRAKQQFAQRSRVRKLQYIAELERNVQALQAEGSEVTAELEFVNQQNLILSLENKALKQRLDSLAQEQLIKYLEQEVLEREIGRLRAMFQQQQLQPHPHQQPPSSSHRRTKSRELDSQFANLSLKHKDTSSGKVVL